MPSPSVPHHARRAIAHASILCVTGMSLAAIITGGDPWPFSAYRMYSVPDRGPVLKRLEVIAVEPDGRETLLLTRQDAIRPFDRSRLRAALQRMSGTPGSGTRLSRALSDVHARYESGRRRARHGGPVLKGLRLEEVEWRLSPDAPARIASRRTLAAVESGP